MATIIRSVGAGKITDTKAAIDVLCDALATYPLDRTFEGYGDFITRDARNLRGDWLEGIERAVGFFGNFHGYSLVFNVTTDDAEIVERLSSAIEANKARPDYLRQPPPYNPGKLQIERIRFSTTQGEVLLTYDGQRIEQYGDKIELRGSEWRGLEDREWHNVARRVLAERHVAAFDRELRQVSAADRSEPTPIAEIRAIHGEG
jgi:hypothetical protein